MEPAVRKTQHRVLVDVAPQLRLDSYPGPLGQVLINLINNSLTHGFAGKECGTISIQAAATVPGWIELSVSDDGCGISAEHQKHIFDPFFTTRLGQGGSGLGLHIVFSLVVELLGGRVDVASAPDAGAAFRVRIPTSAPPTKVLAGSTTDG
jgi:signal transduction histidine kinase